MGAAVERVVVTGLGVVSCIGVDVASFWRSLVNGVSGIDRIRCFDASPLKVRIAGEAREFSFDPRQAKRLERFSQFAVAASAQALEQAGLHYGEENGPDPRRTGVSMGTGIGGFPFQNEQHARFLDRGPGKFHPLTLPIIIPNIAAANVAMRFGLTGPNVCLTTACATGNHSFGNALDTIRLGRADVMLAGGSEAAIAAFTVDGFHQIGALSTRNDDPQRASRPFSRGRDGFVLGEGCGVLVLESLSHAQRRGATILAEVAGFGMTCDAYHLTAPDPKGEGAAQAMRLAMADARLGPGDIDYINAHGTSTPLNDALETLAIKRVFGEGATAIPVSSIKSMVGHSLGAAAALEGVACVLTILHGVIPPTINLDEPDPELDLDYVPRQARELSVRAVMSNSFAFGGQNAVAIFKKFE
jgi:3-oxoacyl-[acyl-carrier-protein] synthase II